MRGDNRRGGVLPRSPGRRALHHPDGGVLRQEDLARPVGEKKGEQIRRALEAGQAVRTELLREQLSPGSSLQNTAAPRPVSTQPLRQQLDAAGAAAQSRAGEAGVPRGECSVP